MSDNSFSDNKIIRDLASLHLIPPPKRTEGDGIENSSINSSNEFPENLFTKSPNLRDQLIYRPEDLKISCTQPPVIQGKMVELVPKNITSHSKKESRLTLSAMSTREPKFVPYEPYKAAVKPIIPYGKIKKKVKMPDPCLPEIKTDLLEKTVNPVVEYETTVSKDEWEAERSILESEMQQLRRDNEQLENQLKFQAQVNGELKNLLVAAVGEDLETRVHILTEDKLQLARALLNSAQKLSTHQEQTEWLAGQCEVWRSRFLASSIMVEELARWKAALNQRSVDLQECMKSLLEERAKVRDNLIATHRDLSVLCDNFDVTSLRGGFRRLSTSHVMDLSDTCKKLSAVLRLQLLGEKSNKCKEPDLTGFDTLTVPEHNAEQLLKHPLPLLGRDDPAYSAVMGAAVALGANHLFSTPAPKCCSHCSGEIKTL